MLKVIYQPDAEAELIEAASFHASRDLAVRDAFLATIHEHVCAMASSPLRFPFAGGQIRRCVVHKYPFVIFFKNHPDHIRILAIAHTSRHPAYWRRRI